jgi:hypothetical protein
MEPRGRSATPKFWLILQPSIVRLYKIAGLVALTAILVGLVGFLTVNIFYFFDHTWVRPVVLQPTHQKVVEASNQLSDAKLRASQLSTETLEIEAQFLEIERTVTADDKFITDVGTKADAPKTAEDWLVARELEKAKLDRDNSVGRRLPLKQRQESLKLRIADQDAVVKRLSASPYLRAVESKVVLAFVPYQNLRNVKIGTKLYSCAWGLVACKTVGIVKTVLEGEVQDVHPHDESIQRGVMMEIELSHGNESSAGDTVLFAESKPLGPFSF